MIFSNPIFTRLPVSNGQEPVQYETLLDLRPALQRRLEVLDEAAQGNTLEPSFGLEDNKVLVVGMSDHHGEMDHEAMSLEGYPGPRGSANIFAPRELYPSVMASPDQDILLIEVSQLPKDNILAVRGFQTGQDKIAFISFGDLPHGQRVNEGNGFTGTAGEWSVYRRDVHPRATEEAPPPPWIALFDADGDAIPDVTIVSDREIRREDFLTAEGPTPPLPDYSQPPLWRGSWEGGAWEDQTPRWLPGAQAAQWLPGAEAAQGGAAQGGAVVAPATTAMVAPLWAAGTAKDGLTAMLSPHGGDVLRLQDGWAEAMTQEVGEAAGAAGFLWNFKSGEDSIVFRFANEAEARGDWGDGALPVDELVAYQRLDPKAVEAMLSGLDPDLRPAVDPEKTNFWQVELWGAAPGDDPVAEIIVQADRFSIRDVAVVWPDAAG
ncbi:hypothetical protein FHS85_003608 [Rhodoligotrophos appendicifer]|uniref:hypothetical protein n=1 Tax=Rhodoligotrophos appendicifer TaxID=987056 RepID=UPI0011852C17|nr:hypothetical protein [Rhodoligotrophos appendicifer]